MPRRRSYLGRNLCSTLLFILGELVCSDKVRSERFHGARNYVSKPFCGRTLDTVSEVLRGNPCEFPLKSPDLSSP